MPLPYELALVTGASSGIGLALARRLSREGVPRLRLLARRVDRLHALAAEIPGAEVVQADLTRPEGLARAAEAAEGVDLLVNNAGFGMYGDFASSSADRLLEMITLNCQAPVRLAHAALPGMLERGRGAIVNVSSGMAFQPSPYLATYAASKAFLLWWSEALHEELRGRGVHVLTVCPGATPTEFTEVAQVPVQRLWVMRFVSSTVDGVVEDVVRGLQRQRTTVVSGASHGALIALGALSPRWVKRALFAGFLRPPG